MLFKTKDLMRLRQPTRRNRLSYVHVIKNQKLLVADEAEFIRHSKDLVALGGELEDSWLNGLVEDLMDGVSRRMAQVCVRN